VNIIEAADKTGNLRIWLAIVRAAGYTDMLKGYGLFTVLAPSDAAFERLTAGTYEELLEDVCLTRDIVSYHLVLGDFSSEDLGRVDSLQTKLGERVFVDSREGVRINGILLVQPDIKARNGVIHILDRVMIPMAIQRDRKASMESGPSMGKHDL